MTSPSADAPKKVLRRADAALALASHEQARLEERQRLARELHVSVSQALYGIALGAHGARWEYTLCLAAAYLIPLLMGLLNQSSLWVMLAGLSIPKAIRVGREVWRQEGRPLNLSLAGTGQLTLVFGILFSLGLVLPLLGA